MPSLPSLSPSNNGGGLPLNNEISLGVGVGFSSSSILVAIIIGVWLTIAITKGYYHRDQSPVPHREDNTAPTMTQTQTQESSAKQSYATSTAADLTRSVSQTQPGPTDQPAPNTGLAQPMPSCVPQQRVPMAHSEHSAGNVCLPVSPISSSPPPVWFSQESPGPYEEFLNHSPHRVLYRNVIYPTAAHLYEAMKFIDTQPDIAQMIPMCRNVLEVILLAKRYEQFIRQDWPYRCLEFLEEVLFIKFKIHPDLRLKLLGTGDARIIYWDQKDLFWGVDAMEVGQNFLGKALVDVRERLRAKNPRLS